MGKGPQEKAGQASWGGLIYHDDRKTPEHVIWLEPLFNRESLEFRTLESLDTLNNHLILTFICNLWRETMMLELTISST